jgi:hypothetical protein
MDVANFFSNHGIKNSCFGYGNTFQNPVTTPNLRINIEEACARKAGENLFKWVYEWPTNDANRQREFIRTGVDAIIAGTREPIVTIIPSDGLATLHTVVQEPEFTSIIRIASREDNPFKPANACYALGVHTGNVDDADTNTIIQYRLTGKSGEAVKVIDASFKGTYNKDQWDYVTIPSTNIGALTSITIFTNGSGSNPTWFLNRIWVKSWRYGVAKDVTFDTWITTVPVTKSLV